MKYLATALLILAPMAPLTALAQDAEVAPPAFVEKAATSNMFEIQSSQMAQDKATDPALKEFAAQMITDHEKAGADLKAAAGDIPVPTELAPKEAEMMGLLEKAEGAEFDDLYKTMQVRAHTEAVALFQGFAENGDDADLKAFATATLPTLEEHKAHIEQITTGQ
ncbi:DUF4142 domain-containing protein [Paracoccus sp. SSK6]|uniref:DUF4142 domain-containing protein n=1 Tax=Paracoccus sp. SSK6 TaxID=3143131 RepID=UPI00321B9AD3